MIIFNHLKLEVFGESHSEKIGFILSNVIKNVEIDFNKIDELITLRQKKNNYNTSRNKKDLYNVISGITNGYTTSRPIVVEILNNGSRSSDYEFGNIRPSHADYIGYKLDGDNFSYNGGGIFSGRNSVLYVIAGEICRQCIESTQHNIRVFSHLSEVGLFKDIALNNVDIKILDELKYKNIQVIDSKIEEEIVNYLETTNNNLGGKITTNIYTDLNLGGYFFNNIKSTISAAMLSIPGTRGIEFGYNDNVQHLDKFYIKDDEVKCDSNYNGGINGGFTSGVTPVEFSVTYKAPSTIFEEVDSIKFIDNTFVNNKIKMQGRHDKIFINRAYYAQEGLCYLIILDYMLFNGVI